MHQISGGGADLHILLPKKIDYSVRNDKVTAQALQEIQGKND